MRPGLAKFRYIDQIFQIVCKFHFYILDLLGNLTIRFASLTAEPAPINYLCSRFNRKSSSDNFSMVGFSTLDSDSTGLGNTTPWLERNIFASSLNLACCSSFSLLSSSKSESSETSSPIPKAVYHYPIFKITICCRACMF